MSRDTGLSAFAARVLVVILLVALALAVWTARSAILLIFFAILLAVAVHGIAGFLRDKAPLGPRTALGLAALLLVGTLCGILAIFGAQIANELTGVFERLPQGWQRIRETVEAHPIGGQLASDLEDAFSSDSGGMISSVLGRAGGVAGPVASGVTTGLLVLFIAGFLTVSASSFRKGALLLLPKGVDQRVGEALDASARALKKWLLGITIDMVIIAVAMGIVLALLGVPAFIGLALIAGLSQFVPTIGPLVSAIPGILLAFTVSPMTAVWTAVAYAVVTQIEGVLIYPLVQERAASIPPALILIAVLVAGVLFGLLGVLLATPLLVVLSVFVVKLYVQDTLGKEASYPGQ